MILYMLERDGGFLAGDTETGRAAYAYPSSDHARLARRHSGEIAAEMIHRANEYADSFPELYAKSTWGQGHAAECLARLNRASDYSDFFGFCAA